MIQFAIVLLYLFSILLISIVFKKFNEDSKEIVRKIIHIGIGPLIPIAQFLKIDQNSALIFTGIVSLITGFFIMSFGDGLAGLLGKSFNSKNWIFFKQKKSLFGTLTMFFTSLIVVCLIGYAQQNSFHLSYFAIAFLATFLEQFSVAGIDNFVVPILSALSFNFFMAN